MFHVIHSTILDALTNSCVAIRNVLVILDQHYAIYRCITWPLATINGIMGEVLTMFCSLFNCSNTLYTSAECLSYWKRSKGMWLLYSLCISFLRCTSNSIKLQCCNKSLCYCEKINWVYFTLSFRLKSASTRRIQYVLC